MKKAWVLSKLYINSLYGISGFIYDLKQNRKAAIRKIALVVLIIVAFSGTVGMFVFFNVKMFDILKPVNQQGIVITLSIILSSILTLVFGIIGAIATYFVDKEGDLILSMPLKPWQILTAKFSSNYIYEAIISLFIMATGFIVYGIKSGSGPYFYLTCIITALVVPLIPLVVGYIIVIPLMRAGSIFRKKDFTMIMTGFIGILFAFGIQYLTQTMVKASSNPAAMLERFASPNGLVAIAGKIYYPSLWATYGIVDGLSVSGLLNFLVYIAISLGVVVLLILTAANIYAESIVGSQEVSKSKKYTEGQLKEKLKGRGILSTLLSREIKLMNREPVYLLNGPLVILLVPAIFGFVIFLQKDKLSSQFGNIASLQNAAYYITLGIAGISVFLGISVNITSTCISREGKAFDLLKSMPVEPEKIILTKLIHGLIFGTLATILCIIIGDLAFNLNFFNLVLAFIIAISIMIPILIAGILLELTWPKLLWDNPQKAMKQNLNGIIMVLGSMCIIPLMGYLVFTFLKIPLVGYAVLIIIPLIITIPLYKLLMEYGAKRFYDIEV